MDDEEVPRSEDKKIPLFLKWTYAITLIIGIVGFLLYWNGSHGFFDKGTWRALQEGARTTYPFEQKVSK